MGTTLVVCLFYDNRMLVAHLGDSRLYLLRDGKFSQVTRDHSLLQEQIDCGIITAGAGEERAAQEPGHQGARHRPDGRAGDPRVPARKSGDVYLLCSDGLCDMVEDEDIGMTLQTLGGNLKLAAQQLVQMANDNGGRDNVSVILVRVLTGIPRPPRRHGQGFRLAKITPQRTGYGETDTQHGWPGAQGDPLDEGAHHHRPQAAQRHPDRQPRGERRARGDRHDPQRLVPRGPRQHQRHAGQRQPGQEALPAEQRRHRARQVQAEVRRRRRAQPAPGEKADFEKTMVLRPSA